MRIENNILGIEEVLRLADREAAYYDLVSLYMKGTNKDRDEIRRGWDYGVKWKYPNPKRLACVKNELHSSRNRVIALLVYESIENFKQVDPRDKLVALAVIYQSCLVAGINPDKLFEEVASISTLKSSVFFRDFIKRKTEDKSLEAFMLTRHKNADGEIEIIRL
ncbi:MAG: hypothetical protein ACRETA_08435 [Gammaproteobacteria bacterium]